MDSKIRKQRGAFSIWLSKGRVKLGVCNLINFYNCDF